MSSITCEATKLDPNRISFIVQALRSKNIMNQLRNWWARIGWKSVSHTVERRHSFSAFCLAEFRSWKNWSCELYVFFLWGNKSKSLIRHVYTLLMILILYFTCTNMYKHTTLFMHLSFWYLIWYEMFPLSLSFRYYQDLEAQRNRFRWVSRKQSDRWHQAHDAQVTKSQESKDSWRTRKMQRVCNHVIVNAAMMHHHIYIYTYALDITWHHLTFRTFPMIASFLGNCWHDIYPTWRTTTKARKPHTKNFPENWKPFAFQGFEGFSDLRTSFLSRFTSGLVFFKGLNVLTFD